MPCIACFIVLLVWGFCVDFHLWCKKGFLVVAVWFLLIDVRNICVYRCEICIFFSIALFCVYSEEYRLCAVIVFCDRPAGEAGSDPRGHLGSLGVCIYVPASRHWLISYSPIHLT